MERELDAAITAAARARSEKRQAEAAEKAAELRAHEVTKELENTSSMCNAYISFYLSILAANTSLHWHQFLHYKQSDIIFMAA